MEKKSDQQLKFGRRLSGMRLEKGIDLSEISKKIKVNINTLHLIESGDHERLPDPVFTKGFIRAYAETIGIDRYEILRLYQESYDHYKNARKAEADLAVYGKKFWRHLIGALALLLVLMAASFFLLMGPHERDKKNDIKAPPIQSEFAGNEVSFDREKEAPQATKNETAETPSSAPSAGKTNDVAKEVQEKVIAAHHLKITAVEDTRIKIIIDDEIPREMLLKAGDIKELTATKRYNILIGNATGIKMELNGKPVEIAGKNGQISTLILP